MWGSVAVRMISTRSMLPAPTWPRTFKLLTLPPLGIYFITSPRTQADWLAEHGFESRMSDDLADQVEEILGWSV